VPQDWKLVFVFVFAFALRATFRQTDMLPPEAKDGCVHVEEMPVGHPVVEAGVTEVIRLGSTFEAANALLTAVVTAESQGKAVETEVPLKVHAFTPHVAHAGAVATRAPSWAARVIVAYTL
jgi:hypothetical protein